jgi:hypothetical protein
MYAAGTDEIRACECSTGLQRSTEKARARPPPRARVAREQMTDRRGSESVRLISSRSASATYWPMRSGKAPSEQSDQPRQLEIPMMFSWGYIPDVRPTVERQREVFRPRSQRSSRAGLSGSVAVSGSYHGVSMFIPNVRISQRHYVGTGPICSSVTLRGRTTSHSTSSGSTCRWDVSIRPSGSAARSVMTPVPPAYRRWAWPCRRRSDRARSHPRQCCLPDSPR